MLDNYPPKKQKRLAFVNSMRSAFRGEISFLGKRAGLVEPVTGKLKSNRSANTPLCDDEMHWNYDSAVWFSASPERLDGITVYDRY